MKILIDTNTHYINFDFIADFYIDEIDFKNCAKGVVSQAKKLGAKSVYRVIATGADMESIYTIGILFNYDTAQMFLKRLIEEITKVQEAGENVARIVSCKKVVRKSGLQEWYYG